MTLTPRTLEIKEEFNNCPGGEVINQYFYEHGLNEDVSFVDVERAPYWENNLSTITVAINSNKIRAALSLGEFAVTYGVDEFVWKVVNDVAIVRIWWD